MPIEEADEPAQPEKLAIGVPGGFDLGKPKEKIEEECAVAVMPEGLLVPLPCPDLPPQILDSVTSIQVKYSAAHMRYISDLVMPIGRCLRAL